jgi:hypothetical protein
MDGLRQRGGEGELDHPQKRAAASFEGQAAQAISYSLPILQLGWTGAAHSWFLDICPHLYHLTTDFIDLKVSKYISGHVSLI